MIEPITLQQAVFLFFLYLFASAGTVLYQRYREYRRDTTHLQQIGEEELDPEIEALWNNPKVSVC
jgi:hypothetical protein